MLGGAGNDELWGGLGADTIKGEGGNDLLLFSADRMTLAGRYTTTRVGSDATVEVTLSTAFVLTDDKYDGGAGSDTLRGTEGNDLITGESVIGGIERIEGGGGNDLINASVGIAQAMTIEGGAGNDTVWGSSYNNWLGGGAGNDQVSGGDGQDTVDGGTGIDTMNGGKGNDLYRVDDSADVVSENSNATGWGDDTVESSARSYTLAKGSNIETLKLTGNAVSGAGNELNNVIVGNGKDNILQGGGGDDLLFGGAGTDSAVYSGRHDDYTVTQLGKGKVRISDNRRSRSELDGTDELDGVEQLVFSDGTRSAFETHLQDDTVIVHADQERNAKKTAWVIYYRDLLANDSVIPDDVPTITQVELTGGSGRVALYADHFEFTPGADFNGKAEFYYSASDHHDNQGMAHITLKLEDEGNKAAGRTWSLQRLLDQLLLVDKQAQAATVREMTAERRAFVMKYFVQGLYVHPALLGGDDPAVWEQRVALIAAEIADASAQGEVFDARYSEYGNARKLSTQETLYGGGSADGFGIDYDKVTAEQMPLVLYRTSGMTRGEMASYLKAEHDSGGIPDDKADDPADDTDHDGKVGLAEAIIGLGIAAPLLILGATLRRRHLHLQEEGAADIDPPEPGPDPDPDPDPDSDSDLDPDPNPNPNPNPNPIPPGVITGAAITDAAITGAAILTLGIPIVYVLSVSWALLNVGDSSYSAVKTPPKYKGSSGTYIIEGETVSMKDKIKFVSDRFGASEVKILLVMPTLYGSLALDDHVFTWEEILTGQARFTQADVDAGRLTLHVNGRGVTVPQDLDSLLASIGARLDADTDLTPAQRTVLRDQTKELVDAIRSWKSTLPAWFHFVQTRFLASDPAGNSSVPTKFNIGIGNLVPARRDAGRWLDDPYTHDPAAIIVTGVLYRSTITLNAADFDFEDPGNSKSEISFKVVALPSKEGIVLEQWDTEQRRYIALDVGATFTLQDMVDQKIQLRGARGLDYNDEFVLEVSDGPAGDPEVGWFRPDDPMKEQVKWLGVRKVNVSIIDLSPPQQVMRSVAAASGESATAATGEPDSAAGALLGASMPLLVPSALTVANAPLSGGSNGSAILGSAPYALAQTA